MRDIRHTQQTDVQSLHRNVQRADSPVTVALSLSTIVQYNLAHMHRPIQYTWTPLHVSSIPAVTLALANTSTHTERLCVSRQYAHAHAIPISSPRRATSPSTWTPLCLQHSTRTPFGTPQCTPPHTAWLSRQYAHMHAVLITAQRGAARARSRPRRGRAPPRLGGAGGGGRGRRVVAEV
jgi:hypothetical protein